MLPVSITTEYPGTGRNQYPDWHEERVIEVGEVDIDCRNITISGDIRAKWTVGREDDDVFADLMEVQFWRDGRCIYAFKPWHSRRLAGLEADLWDAIAKDHSPIDEIEQELAA